MSASSRVVLGGGSTQQQQQQTTSSSSPLVNGSSKQKVSAMMDQQQQNHHRSRYVDQPTTNSDPVYGNDGVLVRGSSSRNSSHNHHTITITKSCTPPALRPLALLPFPWLGAKVRGQKVPLVVVVSPSFRRIFSSSSSSFNEGIISLWRRRRSVSSSSNNNSQRSFNHSSQLLKTASSNHEPNYDNVLQSPNGKNRGFSVDQQQQPSPSLDRKSATRASLPMGSSAAQHPYYYQQHRSGSVRLLQAVKCTDRSTPMAVEFQVLETPEEVVLQSTSSMVIHCRWLKQQQQPLSSSKRAREEEFQRQRTPLLLLPLSSATWVEILQPKSRHKMFANLSTGECRWEEPKGVAILRANNPNITQWWELYDQSTGRFYYYSSRDFKTIWQKPTSPDAVVVPLAKLQILKQNTTNSSSSNSHLNDSFDSGNGGNGGGGSSSGQVTPSSPSNLGGGGGGGSGSPSHLFAARIKAWGGGGGGSPFGPIASPPVAVVCADATTQTIASAFDTGGMVMKPIMVTRATQTAAAGQQQQVTPTHSNASSARIPNHHFHHQGHHPQQHQQQNPMRRIHQGPPGPHLVNGQQQNPPRIPGPKLQGHGQQRHLLLLQQQQQQQQQRHPGVPLNHQNFHHHHHHHHLPQQEFDRSSDGGSVEGSLFEDIGSRCRSPSSSSSSSRRRFGRPSKCRPPLRRFLVKMIRSWLVSRRISSSSSNNNRKVFACRPASLRWTLRETLWGEVATRPPRFISSSSSSSSKNRIQCPIRHNPTLIPSTLGRFAAALDALELRPPAAQPNQQQSQQQRSNIAERIQLFNQKSTTTTSGGSLQQQQHQHQSSPSPVIIHRTPSSPPGQHQHQQQQLTSTPNVISGSSARHSSGSSAAAAAADHTSANLQRVFSERQLLRTAALQLLGGAQLRVRRRLDDEPSWAVLPPLLLRGALQRLEEVSGTSTRPNLANTFGHSLSVDVHHQHHHRMGSGGGGGGPISISPSSISPSGGPPISISSSTSAINHRNSGGGGQTPSGNSTSAGGSSQQTPNNANTSIESFAKECVARHRKGGIFSAKKTLKSMLTHTRKPLKRPMISTISDSTLVKESVACFKLIQIYMGDRPASPPPPSSSHEKSSEVSSESHHHQDSSSAQDHSSSISYTTDEHLLVRLINVCVALVPLRDEVLVQVARQVTQNPSAASEARGLELMAVLFWPSSPATANAPLTAVVRRKFEQQLYRARHTPHSVLFFRKPSSPEEVGRVLRCVRSKHGGLFGETLAEAIVGTPEGGNGGGGGGGDLKKQTLPWPMVLLTEALLEARHEDREGVFRCVGDMDDVHRLKMKSSIGKLTDAHDLHVIASTLKLYFRELREAVIPAELYLEALEAAHSPARATGLLERLPPVNRATLSYLIRFLQVFSAPEHVRDTKMDDANLSMVWAPNILRSLTPSAGLPGGPGGQAPPPPGSTAAATTSANIYEQTRAEMSLVRTLIQHLDTSSSSISSTMTNNL
ncbi:Rho GTPase activating protein 39 [Tyrophagus putrescentiae]|nr:Rho GTPase activating protein 39 [Tyrophagus putrescentiae]